MTPPFPLPPFTLDQAQAAADEWGANCGPGAIAAVCGLTLDALRPHLGNFEGKRYTNPTLMLDTLKRLSVRYRKVEKIERLGLVRIQWEGPWTKPGVPIRARYRHTHWIGKRVHEGATWVFDINAICVGGWIPFAEWSDQLVPWLLKECQPRADGKWHPTHCLEIEGGSQ